MPWGSCTGEVAPTQLASIALMWSVEKRWNVDAREMEKSGRWYARALRVAKSSRAPSSVQASTRISRQ